MDLDDILNENGTIENEIRDFLTALYGNNNNKGYFVLWTKQGHRAYFFSMDEFEEASKKASELCKDIDVYYGVGLQQDKLDIGRGGADTVCSIPGLWLDIDIQGPNHAAENLPPDRDSAMELLKSFGLEPTLIIFTGGGFHVYWLFDDSMVFSNDTERNQAKELSDRFQKMFISLAASKGWKVDKTENLTQLLRLPKTFNHKQDNPVQVKIIKRSEENRYNPEEIVRFIEEYEVSSTLQVAENTDPINEGSRNVTLTRIAGSLRGNGLGYDEIYDRLVEVNRTRCVPPLPDNEIEGIAKSVSSYEPNNNRRPTQGQLLVELCSDLELFHTSDKECYAVVPIGDHKEIMTLKNKQFRNYLSKRYYDQHCSVPGPQALQSALGVLQGRALYESEEKEVFVRTAHSDGSIYLDLCNDDWEVVEIKPDGWEIINDPPVYFRRSNAMLPIPRPVRSNQFDKLYDFINVNTVEQWVLVASFLYGAMYPKGPYPILILQGEQGSAKSTTARVLKDLIDPSSAPLRSFPRTERDLMISANNSWIIGFDNLSGISHSMSDTLCRLSTGGGFSTRGLYTDSDEVIFDAMRPVILNGIDDIANRGDLIDRALFVNLPRIPKSSRKLEQELWEEFKSARPIILGALLNAVSHGLKNIDEVKLDSLPRMADFAKRVVAAERYLPWPNGRFMEIYQQNRDEATLSIFESDPVAITLKAFIEDVKEWKGTAAELKKELEINTHDDSLVNNKYWPKQPNFLSNRVSRIAPSLRSIGIDVSRQRSKGRKFWSFKLDDNYEG